MFLLPLAILRVEPQNTPIEGRLLFDGKQQLSAETVRAIVRRLWRNGYSVDYKDAFMRNLEKIDSEKPL